MKKIFLIAPSGYCSKKDLKQGTKNLKFLNFEVKYNPDITKKFYYYAGTPERRSKEINKAYLDKETSIIFGVRGGMGSIHLLDKLNYKKIKKSKKILIGYSDMTILLNSIYQKTGNRCLHGPTAKSKGFHPKTINSLKDAINKKNYDIKIKKKDIFIGGFSSAKIIGGNLSLLERSLGTKYEINTKNKILFLEQNAYTARMVYDILWQLKLAGKFDNIKGVILGKFTNCGKDVKKYLRYFFKQFNFPVLFNQPFGHEEPNITIPIGETVIIDTKKGFWGIRFKK